MTPERVREAIAVYRAKLVGQGITPERHSSGTLCMRNTDAPLRHVAWMLDQMEGFLDEGRIEKTMRWLGFVQGALWVMLAYTVNDLKEHNMPSGATFEA